MQRDQVGIGATLLAGIVTLLLSVGGEARPLFASGVSHGQQAAPATVRPPAGRLDVKRLEALDALLLDAIAHRQLPGAVIVIGDESGVRYQKAFGNRAVEPKPETMTVDTIFDLASLTKVVATTTSAIRVRGFMPVPSRGGGCA